MSACTNDFRVELYQINCSEDGIGEAAIILVVRGQQASTGIPDQIVSSILIDCGLSTKAADQVERTIDHIKAKYPGDFQFDTVVISHWDRDHYWGFVDFMNSRSTKWDKDASGTDKCSWFKYDAAGNPLTYLYGQEWDNKINDDFALDKTKTFDDDHRTVSVNFKPKKGKPKTNVWRGRLTTETVMGTNLIRNKRLPLEHPRDGISSLDLLLDANPPAPACSDASCSNLQGIPGLYAVGVSNQILGKSGYTVVNEPYNARSLANYKSILLLLVWKTDTEPIASLYTGGDAEWYQEEALGRWLNGTQVSVVKAGHHGSRAGTSTVFMRSAKPDFFLISAGRQYGHPVPELIFFLNAWFSYRQHAASTTLKRIYSTCFPFHMGICSDDGTINHYISHFQQSILIKPGRFLEDPRNPGRIQAFQAALSDLDSTSLQNLRRDLKKQSTLYGQRTVLTKVLREQWTKWSDISQHYFPFRGSELEDARRRDSSRSFLAVLVTITPKDNGITFCREGEIGPKRKRAGCTEGEGEKKRIRTRLVEGPILTMEFGDRLQVRETIATVETAGNETIWPAKAIREILQKDDEEGDNAELESERRKIHVAAADGIDLASIEYPLRFNVVCSTTCQKSLASGCLTPQEDSDLDFFLRQTETCRLQLSEFVSLASHDANWNATVSPAEDLAQWWCEIFQDFEIVSSSFELSGTGNKIDMFKLDRLLSETSTSMKLCYLSDLSTLETTFQIPKSRLSSKLNDNGIQHGTYNLLFGLDLKSCESVDCILSLETICRLMELGIPKWLDPKVQLKLQTQYTSSNEESSLPIINAIWLMPGNNYQTTWRLHAVEATPQTGLTSILFSKLLPDWTIDSASFVFTKTLALLTPEEMNLKSTLTILARVRLGSEANDYWDAYISLHESTAEVCLRFKGSQNPMISFLNWMGKRCSPALEAFNTFENGLNQFHGSSQNSSESHLRQVTFGIDLKSGGSSPSPDSFSITSIGLEFEIDLTWGSAPEPLAFIMTFTWDRWTETSSTLFQLAGSIWPSPIKAEDMDTYKLNPDPSGPPPLLPIAQNYAKTVSLESLPGMGQLGNPCKLTPGNSR